MKKFFVMLLTLLMGIGCIGFTGCGDSKETIIVQTNAFFAPFEYYEGTKIKGVDVDIMNMVGEKLDKKIKFENVEFSAIIDNVAAGNVCDAGAAGITVTPARAEKVDFSSKYYKSVQYVIYKKSDAANILLNKNVDGDDCIFWKDLAGKKIAVQLDTTGHIYVDIEINGDGPEYPGELAGAGATLTPYDSAQLASDAMVANHVDVVVVDELPAQYIVSKNSNLACVPLYYTADTATEEEYAICVAKGNTELLNAINEVLDELGTEGVLNLVKIHMGIED